MRHWARRFLVGSLLAAVGIAAGCGGNVNNLPKTITVAVSPAGSPAIDQGQALTLSVSLVNDISHAGVSWSLTGPGTLSNESTSGATYTAPASVSTTTTVTITITPIARPVDAVSYTLTLHATPAVTTAGALTAATVGTAYSSTLAASGGAGTLNWTVASGTLPAGLTLSKAGVISGTPTAPTNASFTVTVTDSSAGGTLSATSGTITLTANPAPLAVTAPTLANAVQGSAYTSSAFTTTGGTGAITWSATGLPAGLAIDPASGVIGGTPTGSGTISGIVVTATDSGTGAFAQTKSASALSLTIIPTLAVTTSSLNPATVGAAFSQTLTATGGVAPYTWSSTTLPAGLTLDAATGKISGTPTGTSSGTVTFTVKDSGTPQQSPTKDLSLTVGPGTPVITTTSLPGGTVSVAYSQTLAYNAEGQTGTPTFAVSSGTLPPTFSLNATTGEITGNPTATGGPFTFAVTVAVGTATSAPQQYSMSVFAGLAITSTATPANATTNSTYAFTLQAAGGSGSGYTWSLATGSGALPDGLTSIPADGKISFTPTKAGTFNFTVQVTDSASNTKTQAITLNVYDPLTLPAANPASLPSASTTSNYQGSIVAAGGVTTGTYTWTVNGSPLTNGGSGVALTSGLGLSVSANGTNTLSVTGTPTGTGTVTFTAAAQDSAGTTAGPVTYTIDVSTTYSISGTVYLANSCSGGGLQGITVNADSTHSAVTDNTGKYTITGLANGTYTVTPSISGPSSAFNPGTSSITISNANANAVDFNASLGYTVSGTVSYAGSQTGPIYISLNGTNCNNYGTQGTTVTSLTSGSASYTVQGVPPGTYTVSAWMDSGTVKTGQQSATDPSGAGATGGVVVTNANVSSGADVTLTDPGTVTLATAPKLKGVAGMNNAALIQYSPLTDSNNVEQADAYTVEWEAASGSTCPTPFSAEASQTFAATGTSGAQVFFLNSGKQSTVVDGASLCFRMHGSVTQASKTSNSPDSTVFGPVAIGAPSTGNAVSGTVNLATPKSGAALYTGFYDQNSGMFYGEYFATPSAAQTYSIMVPSGTSYIHAAILDQDNNGVVNAGDQDNISHGSDNTAIAISTATSGLNLTLSSANSSAKVTTDNFKQTTGSGSSQSYSLTFSVNAGVKLPVAVQLTSATPADVVTPMDIANCSSCGHGFQINLQLGATAPQVGDSYSFNVTYSDGTSETVTAQVTAVLTDFATGLTPNASTASPTTTPTFTWSYPASNASTYTYSFNLNSSTGGTIWQIPGQNSNTGGFTTTTVPTPQFVWATDPTDSSNVPSPNQPLTSGNTYNWQIQTRDSNGNTATQNVSFKP